MTLKMTLVPQTFPGMIEEEEAIPPATFFANVMTPHIDRPRRFFFFGGFWFFALGTYIGYLGRVVAQ